MNLLTCIAEQKEVAAILYYSDEQFYFRKNAYKEEQLRWKYSKSKLIHLLFN